MDPMTGSGTTLHAAIAHGCDAIGCDLDPLAVLLAKVRTTSLDVKGFQVAIESVAAEARLLSEPVEIESIDGDAETAAFVDFWFAEPQQSELRALISVINRIDDSKLRDALFVAFSRLIVTKGKGASLGRDVSHSRPHRVGASNDFRVFDKFVESGKRMARNLVDVEISGRARVFRGDARVTGIRASSVDLIITSPPYLNAIDYLRGHKLSLVWLGYTVCQIREIRGTSVGAEKGIVAPHSGWLLDMRRAIGGYPLLAGRYQRMVDRYLIDLFEMYSEQGRILRSGGRSTTVIGNSALRGCFLRNDEAAIVAAEANGLQLVGRYVRDLPSNRRYLPPPVRDDGALLDKRMRTETVLKFRRVGPS